MLNLEQQKAVYQTEGPVRIIAGAGTGKTHTLISRIAYLIKEKKVKPEKILVLTFTNKAAHKINEHLLKRELKAINITTFYALSAQFLREFKDPESDTEQTNFTDLPKTLINMWKERPHALLKCKEKYQYIMIDEYQDMNSEQIEIMMKLSEDHYVFLVTQIRQFTHIVVLKPKP